MSIAKENYHHGELRRALIEAAVAWIESTNGQIPSFRELARAVGVTSGAPFHHFKNREELLGAIAADGFEVLLAELNDAVETTGDGEQRVAELARRYVRFGRVRRAYYRIMFGPECAATRSAVEVPAGSCLKILDDAVLQLHGNLTTAHSISLSIWAFLHGIVDLGVGGPLEHKLTQQEIEWLAVNATLTLTSPHRSSAPV